MQHDPAPPSFSRGHRIGHLCWALVLLLPAAIVLYMAGFALNRWNPAHASEPPVFSSTAMLTLQLWGALVIASLFGALAIANFTYAFASCCGMRRWDGILHWIMVAGMLIAMSPVAVLMLLPMEDPYTGAGSPAAAMLGLFFLGALCMLFAAPGLPLLIKAWRQFMDRDSANAVAFARWFRRLSRFLRPQ